MALNLLHQQRQVAAGSEGNHPELIRELFGDLEGLGSDRPRGAQHADGFHRRAASRTSLPSGLANTGKLAHNV